MVAPTSPDQFVPCLNETFTLNAVGESRMFTLQSVDRRIDDEFQLCFSLLFHCTGPAIPQHTCRLQHTRFGALDLFLVPIQRKRDGFLYEAVFNLLKDEAQPPVAARP